MLSFYPIGARPLSADRLLQSSQELDPPLLTNSQTFYAPQLNLTIAPSLLINTQTFYSEQINLNINFPLLTNGQTFFGPKVGENVVAPLLINNQTFYSATLNQTLHFPLFTNTQAFYSPSVSQPAGSQIIRPSLLVNKVGDAGVGQQFFSYDVRLAAADETISDFSSGKPRYRRNY